MVTSLSNVAQYVTAFEPRGEYANRGNPWFLVRFGGGLIPGTSYAVQDDRFG